MHNLGWVHCRRTAHLTPQHFRRSLSRFLQAGMQPVLLARREQQHVLRKADLRTGSTESIWQQDNVISMKTA